MSLREPGGWRWIPDDFAVGDWVGLLGVGASGGVGGQCAPEEVMQAL